MKRTMLARVRTYLEQRRALGYKLRIEGQMLLSFARYADRSGHRGPLTRKLALHWAALPQQATRLYRARRLEVLRVFARHQTAVEPATELPPRYVFGPAHVRRAPHIYRPAQILQSPVAEISQPIATFKNGRQTAAWPLPRLLRPH